jgi:hypothetical protein
LLFLINALFLLSLHVFVQKLVSRYFFYKAESLEELNYSKIKEKRFIYSTMVFSMFIIAVMTVTLYFIWNDILREDYNLNLIIPGMMIGLQGIKFLFDIAMVVIFFLLVRYFNKERKIRIED